MELSLCVQDAAEAYNHVEKWAKTERAPFSVNYFPMGPKIRKEPKGVVLIIRYVRKVGTVHFAHHLLALSITPLGSVLGRW